MITLCRDGARSKLLIRALVGTDYEIIIPRRNPENSNRELGGNTFLRDMLSELVSYKFKGIVI